ncbi:MAG: transglycosylase SLT domain-containing protein [Actinomycetota bacterium]
MLVAAGLAAGLSPVALSPVAAAETDAKLVHEALAQAKREHFTDAERLARQSHNKLLAKLVKWMEFTSPRSGASFADITAFMEAEPDWPLMTTLQKRAEESITAATPTADVLAWFEAHPPATVDGGMAWARALLASGKSDKAVKVIRNTWVDGGFGVLQERQFLTLFGEHVRAEDHWRRLDRLLWDKQDGPAQRMLLKVDAGHRALAQARLALQDGKAGVEGLIAAVPATLRDDPGLIYDRVRWRRQKDMDEDAIDLLSHPARNQVRPELWWQERSILARRALQKGLVSQAYRVASDHGLAGGSQLADAEFLAGWIALRFLDDRETALAHFQRLYDTSTHPITRARAAYWAGRASEAARDDRQAREWYTTSARYVTAYYGQLAAARLDNHHWPLPGDPKPTPEDIRRFEGREVTKATRLLMEMRETEQLRAFFIRLNDVATTPGERVLVAQLAAEGGRNDLAVTVARRSDRDGVTLVEAGWPVPHVAAEDTPEKALVLALIRQESGFMQDVVSSAGARGLMQLLPSTAEKVAKAIKVAFHPRKLDDPNFNVRIGSAYLGDLLSDFEGSYILALAAYNAGPSRARRWIKEYGDPRDPQVDVIDWIEMIPFTETRNYVQRVMESVAVYRRRLGKAGGPTLEADLKRWARRSAQ